MRAPYRRRRPALRAWTRSRAAACRAAGRRSFAAARAAARRCWRWSSWCAARTEYDEPGVFIAFEETAEELPQNVRSLGFDLDALIARKKIAVDYVRIERSEIEETGEYDLDGLFIRLGARDRLGRRQARRARHDRDAVRRLHESSASCASELRRLFRWLKDEGVTASSPASAATGTLTRQGLEEYVSDCVILLDHRVNDQISTRRLRIVKYRGSLHGTNEYPFLIDERGISVLPMTVARPRPRGSSTERISIGHPGARRHAGRRGLLPRQQRCWSRHRRHRQDQPRGALRRARPARRGERCLYLRLRGVAEPDRAQHALHRRRPRAVASTTALLRLHAIAADAATASRCTSSTIHKLVVEFEPSVGDRRPDQQLHVGRARAADAQAMLTAPDRLPEVAADHGAVYAA